MSDALEFDGRRFQRPGGAAGTLLMLTLDLAFRARRGHAVPRALLDQFGTRLRDVDGVPYWPVEEEATAEASTRSEICEHRGAVVPTSSTKTYYRCEHPQRQALGLAAVVCPCGSCNRKCPGYKAE